MGSPELESPNQWTTGRVLRLVVPSLVVLVVALVLREPGATAPEVETSPKGGAGNAVLAPAPANRILIFAEDATALTAALDAQLVPGTAVVAVPKSKQAELAEAYGVAEFPTVIIEQAGSPRTVCSGGDAGLAAVLRRCRELGLLRDAAVAP